MVGRAPSSDAAADDPVIIAKPPARRSLARRMMAIAAVWIGVLLLAGGFALDRTLVRLVEDNFDEQLEYVQT
ncbi:MAG: histidine kinase, partial [Pseudomonadota bacterium]|nr:histidine kinase [Pseudomonadota bacterium]